MPPRIGMSRLRGTTFTLTAIFRLHRRRQLLILPRLLPLPHLRIQAIRRQQLLMRPALDDPAVIQHQDLLRIGHRRQAVRDHQRGAVLRNLLQLRLDRLLRL